MCPPCDDVSVSPSRRSWTVMRFGRSVNRARKLKGLALFIHWIRENFSRDVLPFAVECTTIGSITRCTRLQPSMSLSSSSPTLASSMSNLTPAFTFTLAIIFNYIWSQTRVMEAYPEEITVVFIYNLFANANLNTCMFDFLGPLTYISLAAIIYSGVFVSLLSALTHTWGLHLKGPVYVSMFRPLSIAIAVSMGAIYSSAVHFTLGGTISFLFLLFRTSSDSLSLSEEEGSLHAHLITKPDTNTATDFSVLQDFSKHRAREDSTRILAGSEHCSPLLLTHIVEDEALSTTDLMERGAEEKTVALRYFCGDVVPFAAMVSVECVTVGSNTLFKAATLRGLSFYVYIFYSYVVATIVLLPLSLIFRRSRRLPSAKFPVFVKIFFLAILGLMSGLVGLKGVEYSSPTLSSAISNLTPAFTFTLAIIFRIEQVRLRSSATQAKIIGTIVSISGALVVVLYKGHKVLTAAPSPSNISLDQHLTSSNSSWMIGGLLLASQYFFISVWYIVQVCMGGDT
ncbi:hypothetical protein DY000_02060971 [Brassica cretica]|uniref:EamA domain-containing protein n=1 Tax=Brassica cretica TaxID=69181 RepID=A0ABQ7ATH6_BRACR|nr:hypothetical protein DY000_02060971 [Brassica cretica]